MQRADGGAIEAEQPASLEHAVDDRLMLRQHGIALQRTPHGEMAHAIHLRFRAFNLAPDLWMTGNGHQGRMHLFIGVEEAVVVTNFVESALAIQHAAQIA